MLFRSGRPADAAPARSCACKAPGSRRRSARGRCHTRHGSCPRRAKQRHTAQEQLVELVQIYYPYHPRKGAEVEVLGRSRLGDEDFLIIRQPDGTPAHIPRWITLPSAAHVPMRIVRPGTLAVDAAIDSPHCPPRPARHGLSVAAASPRRRARPAQAPARARPSARCSAWFAGADAACLYRPHRAPVSSHPRFGDRLAAGCGFRPRSLQVITSGRARPVRALICASSSASLIGSASAACASWASRAGSAS